MAELFQYVDDGLLARGVWWPAPEASQELDVLQPLGPDVYFGHHPEVPPLRAGEVSGRGELRGELVSLAREHGTGLYFYEVRLGLPTAGARPVADENVRCVRPSAPGDRHPYRLDLEVLYRVVKLEA